MSEFFANSIEKVLYQIKRILQEDRLDWCILCCNRFNSIFYFYFILFLFYFFILQIVLDPRLKLLWFSTDDWEDFFKERAKRTLERTFAKYRGSSSSEAVSNRFIKNSENFVRVSEIEMFTNTFVIGDKESALQYWKVCW